MKFANLRLDDEVILWRKGAWPKQAKAITMRLMNTFRTGTWPARAAGLYSGLKSLYSAQLHMDVSAVAVYARILQ